jgi:hypothetical protein
MLAGLNSVPIETPMKFLQKHVARFLLWITPVFSETLFPEAVRTLFAGFARSAIA